MSNYTAADITAAYTAGFIEAAKWPSVCPQDAESRAVDEAAHAYAQSLTAPAGGVSDAALIVVYDAVSRSNITRDVKTAETKARIVREALSAPEPAAQGEVDAPSIEAAKEMGAKGGPTVEAERWAFEAWMHGHCWSMCATWDGKSYRGMTEQGDVICPNATRTRQMWAAWRDRAALAAQPAERVPEGWHLVPRYLTAEMDAAGWPADTAQEGWERAIDAAPTPPSAKDAP